MELSSVLWMLLPSPVEFQLVADDRIGQCANYFMSAGVDAGNEISVVELAEDAGDGALNYFIHFITVGEKSQPVCQAGCCLGIFALLFVRQGCQ